ncbi:Oxysterol-binding protein-related protein 3 [Hypsibius exemplaris]|uniref:Oxysterol-binding protein n=1 Tax=Hypsibius exemplaris TaxID=2072580 RepID=A0A1W0WV19_HYPEX|nr:Oxysterol-binding protein-related protein 3 [Hypsibius exemplaris]
MADFVAEVNNNTTNAKDVRPISLPITISSSSLASASSSSVPNNNNNKMPAASSSAMPGRRVPAHNGSHSPSSNSMSSTPSGDGSSSQSEYFSYEPTAERTGSLKATPTRHHATEKTFAEWKPSLGTEYEILQSLKVGERFDEQVAVFEGILSKKRRRRGTGFQKRYCRLDQGYLLYAKNRADMGRGVLLGTLDIGLSVVVLNAKKRGIEIDSTEALHHFRVATEAQFLKWAQMLRDHRLFRQATMAHLAFSDVDLDGTMKDATILQQPSGVAARRFGLDVSKAQLDAVFSKLDRAAALVEQWDMASSEPILDRDIQNTTGDGPRKTTLKRFFSRRKKADKKEKDDAASTSASTKGSTVTRTATMPDRMDTLQLPSSSSTNLFVDVSSHGSVSLPPSSPHPGSVISESSHHGSQSSLNKITDLSPVAVGMTGSAAGGSAAGSSSTSRPDLETLLLARELVSTFRVIGNDFRQLYNRFNSVLGEDATLKGNMMQNRIVHTLSSDSAGTIGSSETFFTAISHFSGATLQNLNAPLSDSSSDRGESRDEGCSTDSEIEDGMDGEIGGRLHSTPQMTLQTGRRTTLPSPRPLADGSLLKMIGGFIGKDLTRLALPVKINEPLSMLQRLCEEMEYCELLDKAADCIDPVERMTLVATFAISGFASAYYRASTKPFNPLLGETYECIREDKGFRYVGEQVSHHPPISACHAESLNDKYCYWQDFRPKTRFWGRSIEITNHGEVHVTINKSEHYRWNKPSSRLGVAALMSQKGHLEIYGTIKITCSNDYYATLTFGKSSSEGTPVHVEGSVHGPDRAPLTALFGSWNECVYWNDPGKTGTRVLWRAGAMPADHERYYGFTRFAVELNELTDDLTKVLPVTDCRFRPDQRLLECGNLASAEIEKKRVEQNQRERSLKYTKDHYPYEPRWFRRLEQAAGGGNDVPDIYEFNYRYWMLREHPGFPNVPIEPLW